MIDQIMLQLVKSLFNCLIILWVAGYIVEACICSRNFCYRTRPTDDCTRHRSIL